MATVLDALVPYVKKLIEDMAPILLGVSGEITRLESNIESIHALAADAERRRITDMSVQRWVRKLRDAMYDVTDILELCQLEVSEPEDSRLEAKVPGCFQLLLLCRRNPLFTHKISNHIKELNQRLEYIHKEAAMFEFSNVNLCSNPEPRTSELSMSTKMRSEFDESVIVGKQIERDTKELAQVLLSTNGSPSIKVVSIVGAGGMGKTTLARKIFNCSIIQEHFRTRIWLCISTHFREYELLRSAIMQARGDHGGEHHKSILMNTLIRILSAGRFLLVMDDVWTVEAWNNVFSVPVRNASMEQPGSRVLVTTRHPQLPQQMRAPLHEHQVGRLRREDAWSLLKKQLPPDQVAEIDQLRYIGMGIHEMCDGSPLAIKVVGGLLSMRHPSEQEWESVLIKLTQTELPRDLPNWFYLSYLDLSPQLKQCFLYCSLFPEGQEIIQERVIKMWLSEGFIQPPDENSTTRSHEHELEDIAIKNYLELMKRNLIEPISLELMKRNLIEPISSTAGYMCTMHDLVRSFAQYMAREEALVVQRQQEIESSGGQSKLLRRLSIESTESIAVEWSALQKLVSLRLLILDCKINFKHGDSLSNFSSLRVLHIVSLSDSDRLVSSLCQLKHLRYLYLDESDISRLPDDIDRMKFLQHIGIVNCKWFVHLPRNIIKLRQLRSLSFVGSSVDVIPRGFGSLTNLRSLLGFPVHKDNKGQSWCSLEELAPLYQLRSLSLEGIEKVDAMCLAAAKNMIITKFGLSYLHLRCNDISRATDVNVPGLANLIEQAYEHLTPPPELETFIMKGYIGHRLPYWMWAPKAVTFRLLRYMKLKDLVNCTQLPDGLCQMPSLKHLNITYAPQVEHVGPEFLHNGGVGYAFPRLQQLRLYGMVKWSDWDWGWESCDSLMLVMPVLEELLVDNCKLRSLPPGLSYHARALRQLHITDALLLESLENFPSLVELDIYFSPELSRIADLPRLQKLTIIICPKLRVLEGVPALTSLVVQDYKMKTLPGYLLDVCPSYLTLDCTIKLLKSISMQDDDDEWHKISHIQNVNAYAEADGYQGKCYVLYTRDPYSFEAMLDSKENLTDDEFVGSDTQNGSAENLTNDKLVGSDIPSGSTGVDLFNDDSEPIGTESPREEIIKMLMLGQDSGKQQLQVVSICGIGGLGKKTVAKAVCRQIANQFDCHAFVSVSQGPSDNEGIIKNIFDQVHCPYPILEECVSQQLIDRLIGKLKEFLQDKRYLIVVNDIWDLSLWEMIKPALVGNNHRSGIIATTCKVGVAESIGGVYRLPLLSNEDSKILFYRRTYFGSEDRCPSEYRELSKRILNKCGQLPLAIITIAGLLPKHLIKSKEEWKKVCNSIGTGSELGDSVKDMRRILSRSYYGLPQHLRKCFLYLRIFPEYYVIRRDSLVQRWLSEGLIRGDHEQNLREMGEGYFYQLLDTGLIQPIEHGNDDRALACQVPGVMIDLIFSLIEEEKHSLENEIKEMCALQQETEENCAHEEETEKKHALQNEIEALKKQIEEKRATAPVDQRLPDPPPHKVEMLSLQVKQDVEKTTKSFWQSSLSISCSVDATMDALQIYKNLRVVVLEGALENRHIAKYLGSLRQLTCLILSSTQITVIPKKVGNLQLLHTLDLRATSVHELPCAFVRLKHLRCLLINRSTKVPAGICNLEALEEVQDIDASKSPDILEGICTLPELRVLGIAFWSWDESSSKLLPETLCKLRTTKLKHLSICTSCSLEFKPKDGIKKTFQHIEKLEIQHSTFDTLPTWIGELKKLSSLSIEVYLLRDSALQILGGLPDLLFLSLTAKKTAEGSPKQTPEGRVVGEDKLLVGSNGFSNLKTLHLFSRAIGIKFEQESMKKLERLKVSFQAAALTTDDLSFGLENLSSLKQVQVEIICFSATEKAVKKAEDALRGMIWENPRLPRPALEIRRSAEDYMVEDKREFREELRDKILASWDGRTASVQKDKQKRKNA